VSPAAQPILFIPGNAGSFKQVRSMASSAAHQFWQGEFAGREGYDGVLSRLGHDDEVRKPLKDRVPGMKELDFFASELQ
jgi:hypothetical protein